MANGMKFPSVKVISGVVWLLLALFGGELRADTMSVRVGKSARLDTATIRKFYLEGEFKKVADSLESFRQAGSPGSHADSVFVYRHLGIVYASNETTKLRAESYLNLLLRLEPETEILDPFVSATVDAFWESIRTRHQKVSGRSGSRPEKKYDPVPLNNGSSKQNVRFEDEKNFPWVWMLAGTALVGGAVGFYLWDQNQSETPKTADPVFDTANITIKLSK